MVNNPGSPTGNTVDGSTPVSITPVQGNTLNPDGNHTGNAAGPTVADGANAPTTRVRKPKSFEDEISIMTVVFGKGWGKPFMPGGGGTHTDVQEGNNVWNAKKGWNVYGSYGPRARIGERAFKPVDVTKPKEAVAALMYNASLKPFNRYVLKLTPDQKAAIRQYLNERKDIPKGMLHTCVNATSAMLKEVLGVEVPWYASQSPTAFAKWMRARAADGAPWIERVEHIGEIKDRHFYMGAVKNVATLGVAATAATGMYGLFRAASSLFGDKEDSKEKEKPDKNDIFEIIGEDAPATEGK